MNGTNRVCGCIIMCKISVVIPVYNTETFLIRCIESFFEQTYKEFEIILVDDGSTDSSGAICDECAEKDSRIHVIHQQNIGAAGARNAGIDWVISNNKSEWITFIDSDDYVHCRYLEYLIKAALDNNVNISVCYFQREPFKKIDVFDYKCTLISSKEFFEKNMITGTVCFAKLYKVSCLLNDRFPHKQYEDEYFTWKLLFRNEEIALVDAPLYVYYTNENSVMRKIPDEKKLLNFDSTDAFVEQALWFKNKDYDYLSSRSDRNAVLSIVAKNRFAEQSYYYKKLNGILIRKLRKTIRFLKSEKLYMPIEENLWVYKIAYPTKTSFQIMVHNVLYKLRGIIKWKK